MFGRLLFGVYTAAKGITHFVASSFELGHKFLYSSQVGIQAAACFDLKPVNQDRSANADYKQGGCCCKLPRNMIGCNPPCQAYAICFLRQVPLWNTFHPAIPHKGFKQKFAG